jgi:hypothetical protein
MSSYMYNPSKKVTELLSKFLEFDPEQLQLGIWSGDLCLTNVNLRGDALYSKINRMKKSPSGRDPLMLKLEDGTISLLRIQIPWKRLVWGQGDVIIDIKGLHVVVGFESRDETEQRQKEDAAVGRTNEKSSDDDDEPILKSKEFRDSKQKILAEAEQRLMEGQNLSSWLAHVIKKELTDDLAANKTGEKKIKGFEKWMKKASSSFVWRFLSGLKLNIEGLKLTIVQDEVEVGLVMPNTQVFAGKDGAYQQTTKRVDNEDEEKSAKSGQDPPDNNHEREHDGDHIEKTIKAQGVSVFARRKAMHHQHQSHDHSHAAPPIVLLPDDYVLRPVDLSFSFTFFYPHPESVEKRKAQQGSARAFSDNTSVEDSSNSSRRRRGKRDKLPSPKQFSVDGTAETDLVSSFAPESAAIPRQRNPWNQYTDNQIDDPAARLRSARRSRRGSVATLQRPNSMHNLLHASMHRQVRSAPLVNPEDLGSVYASVMAEKSQPTASFTAQMNCGEIKLLWSTQHMAIMQNFLAVGARMRNGRPTSTIADVLVKGEHRGTGKRSTMNTASSGVGSDFTPPPNLGRTRTNDSGFSSHRLRNDYHHRRLSLGLRNELAAKAQIRRKQVIRSWWHYAYGVVAYEIQKRKKRRDNFKDKYVSFDWDRQRQKRKQYINLYLSLQLDVNHHVSTDASVQIPDVEELLRIEDELPVEQILLYRSIARALIIHDIDYMPESIEILYRDYASELAVDRRRASLLSRSDRSMRIGKRLSVPDNAQQTGSTVASSGEGLLSIIGNRCNDARKYRTNLAQENVQLFDEPSKILRKSAATNVDKEKVQEKRPTRTASMGLGNLERREARFEDFGDSKVSFAYDAAEDVPEPPIPQPYTPVRRKTDNTDMKTVRTFKTAKSAKTRSSAIAGTVVENITINETAEVHSTAKISFSLNFKSVELMLVADDRNAIAIGRAASRQSQSASRSGSSDDVSELSFLSEEDFFREQESAPVAAAEEDPSDKPILSSTDFLLFGLPRNMLLHVTLAPLRCSILGRSGGSKNINFTIGSITASGGGHDNLIAIGSRASPTPIPVVSLSKGLSKGDRGGYGADAAFSRFAHSTPSVPKEAVKLSFVKNQSHNVLQADVSKIHLCLDITLLLKLMQFASTTEEGNPKRMLPKSSREEARLFILRENPPSKLTGINSSIRIHGIDVSIPVDPLENEMASDSSSSSQHSGNDNLFESNSPSARISTRIIEVYSGSAVSDLCGGENGGQVGSLEMLDVAELIAARDTLSSHHCVSRLCAVFERRFGARSHISLSFIAGRCCFWNRLLAENRDRFFCLLQSTVAVG